MEPIVGHDWPIRTSYPAKTPTSQDAPFAPRGLQTEKPILLGPNHTQLSNTFLDEYMYRLAGSTVKVFLAIARKTIGWHKQTDAISQRQMQDMTGIASRHTIRGAVDELLNVGLIVVAEKSGSTTKYTVNYTGAEIAGGGAENEPVTGAVIEPTKETLKETNQKKKKHPKLGVSIGETRYNTLCGQYTQAVVDDAIQERMDWEETNGRKPAKDYATAAANWLKNAEKFGNPKAKKWESDLP